MSSDNGGLRTYSAAMAAGEPHIILKLDTDKPIELGAFVAAFAALGNEYERYIKSTNSDLASDAQMYVRQVKPGCVEADLVPWLSHVAPFISEMDKALIVELLPNLWTDLTPV